MKIKHGINIKLERMASAMLRKKSRKKRHNARRKEQQLKKERYRNYLKSPEWQVKREQFFDYIIFTLHQKIECSSCHTNSILHVHHKTYDHLYNEKLTDLQLLCEDCHAKVHRERKERGVWY